MTIAARVSAAFANPAAIVGFPVACVAYLLVGGSIESLTLVLSILAISMTQMVLAAQTRDTKAVHRKLDDLIRGVPGADDAIAGCESDR